VDLTIRRATEADWPTLAQVDSRNFGFRYSDQDLEDARLIVDVDRFFVATDGPDIVGLTGDYQLHLTVPGGTEVPAAGVTWVSVNTTHRRRGVLTALLLEQHRSYLEEGYTMAILGASESGIYGRFGYGAASEIRRLEIDRRAAQLRRDVPESGPVRMIEADEARALVPTLHDRWRRVTPGAVGRSDAWWDFVFLDREHRRHGLSSLFHAVHPDGFVTYRIRPQFNEGFPAHEVEVVDLFPVTAGAHADLWRFLLSIDLAGPIRTWGAPPGDPLPFLLDQPRQARTTNLSDDVWLRLLDVASALAARTYQVDGSLVLGVDDGFLDRGGRFLLEGGPGGATCTPTDREPELELGIAALGSLYLGGHRARTLAEAGLVDERSQGSLHRAALMFGADRPPHCGTHF
jgi:predicted acetyltransferase